MMSEYLDWKVGDEVVCIDDCFHQHNGLHKGTIYKISKIKNFDGWSYNGNSIAIKLEGLLFPVYRKDGKCATHFGAHRFRKVQKRKTDISMFTEMLNKTPAENKKELADV